MDRRGRWTGGVDEGDMGTEEKGRLQGERGKESRGLGGRMGKEELGNQRRGMIFVVVDFFSGWQQTGEKQIEKMSIDKVCVGGVGWGGGVNSGRERD